MCMLYTHKNIIKLPSSRNLAILVLTYAIERAEILSGGQLLIIGSIRKRRELFTLVPR